MSDDFSIDVDDREVSRLIARAPDRLGHALEGAGNDVSALMLRDLTTYPQQSPESTYHRTMTEARSWSREFSGRGLEFEVVIGSNGNIAPYNIYVQDEDRQAEVHRGVWENTVQATARRYEDIAQDAFEARVQMEVNNL